MAEYTLYAEGGQVKLCILALHNGRNNLGSEHLPQSLSGKFLRIVWKCFWLKSIGTTAFTTVFFLIYIYLLKHPAATVTVMPMLWLDDWIDFQPWALIPYLSLWVYVSLPPLFLTRWQDLVAYGWRIGVMCSIGLLVFHFWPTAVPPVQIDWARYPGVAFLKGVDAAGNACPSLHVATAAYSAVWLHRMADAAPRHALLKWLNAIWCGLIVYSTMATRQHVALDVFFGLLLAGGCAAIFMFDRRRIKALPIH